MNNRTSLRILDANLNRAREALRVMEEYARLGLDDASLSKAIKETRHALAAAVEFERGNTPTSARAEARGSVIEARDIVGDVGCDVATPSEYRRDGAFDVVRAAAKRLTEALRAVEEYGKTLDAPFAATIEKLRYRAYELERRLHLTVGARERFGQVRLYVIITQSLCHGEWLATAESALQGGANCLQLREKDLPDRELLGRAKQLATLCHQHDALFIVNDRPDIAALSGADGVHLGQDDMPIAAARRLMPAHALVGVSTHTQAQIEQAATDAPDYVAVGPMFDTPTKPQNHIAGANTIAAAREITSLPLVAIGGINEGNAQDVLAAAPCALCVCRAIIAQSDVTGAARRIRVAVDGALQQPCAAG